jgi:hypothetical protein
MTSRPLRGPRGTFRSRTGGFQQAQHVWICQGCRAWAKGQRPAECVHCNCPDLWHCDSAGEAKRFMQLLFRQDIGDIIDLEHHPRFPILVEGPAGPKPILTYEADASYQHAGKLVVEDVKPSDPRAQDPIFRLKRKLFEHQYATQITLVAAR